MGTRGIAHKRFVVLGRVGMDLTAEPIGAAVPEATGMLVSMGGSSANIAAGLVKLGCAASLVTCVSDDGVGQYCLNQLDAYGIGRDHVRRIKGEERTSLAVVDARIEDHNTVIYRNNAADFQMSATDVEAVDYAGFGALITTGTVFAAEPSRSAAFRAFELARAAGLPVIFDVDYRPYSWPSAEVASDVLSRAAALSDVIVGNDEEFGFMAGGIDKGLAKARDLAATSAGIVVYKMRTRRGDHLRRRRRDRHRHFPGRRPQTHRRGRQFHGRVPRRSRRRPADARGDPARLRLRLYRRRQARLRPRHADARRA